MKIVKGTVFIVLFLIFGFTLVKEGLSLNLGRSKMITVVGEGKVKMKPEVARFTVGVQTYGATILETMEKANSISKEIISVLKSSGVNEEDIKTASFNVWPQTSDTYENNIRRQIITGYSVSNNLEVKVKNINIVSDLLSKVINAGANNIYGMTFEADNPKEQEAEARKQAINNAEEKAESMAQAAGKRLGKIVSISEGSGTYTAYQPRADAGGGPAIETGSLEITQTVSVVFELK